MITPDEQILICAVRYALGRISYVVGDVVDYVHYKKERLSSECKHIIARDIQEELESYHRVGRALGMECDERKWITLMEELNEAENEKKQK